MDSQFWKKYNKNLLLISYNLLENMPSGCQFLMSGLKPDPPKGLFSWREEDPGTTKILQVDHSSQCHMFCVFSLRAKDCTCHQHQDLLGSLFGNHTDQSLFSTGLSLRAGGRGLPPATMSVSPGYFYWKIEENQNQKKLPSVQFRAYLFYLPGNLKSQRQPCQHVNLPKSCSALQDLPCTRIFLPPCENPLSTSL